MINNEKETRNEEIVSLYEAGVPIRKIANRFGISYTRVSQICRRSKEEDDLIDRYGEWLCVFSTRTMNALARAGIYEMDALIDLCKNGWDGDLRNLGVKGWAEIVEKLDIKQVELYNPPLRCLGNKDMVHNIYIRYMDKTKACAGVYHISELQNIVKKHTYRPKTAIVLRDDRPEIKTWREKGASRVYA